MFLQLFVYHIQFINPHSLLEINMNTPCFIIIFFILLLLYLHYCQQFEFVKSVCVYEISYMNKKDLFMKCDVKQPIIIDAKFLPQDILEPLQLSSLENNFSSFVSIRKNEEEEDEEEEMEKKYILSLINIQSMYDRPIVPIEIPFSTACNIMQHMPHYVSRGNKRFLKEVEIQYYFKEIGEYLKPNFLWKEDFDLWYSPHEKTVFPFEYHTESYKFYFVSCGSISVKFVDFQDSLVDGVGSTPTPTSFFPHKSTFGIIEEMKKKKPVFSTKKEKTQEINVYQGQFIYIPPYCLYSIQFQEKNTCLCEFQYTTIFHNFAHLFANRNQIFSSFLSFSRNSMTPRKEDIFPKLQSIVEL